MKTLIVIVLVLGAVVAGILFARKNSKKVDKAVDAAKNYRR